jgi:hypothetical protein
MENLWIRPGETPAGPGPVPWPSSNSEAVLEPEPHLSSGKHMKNAPKSIKGHTKMPILAQPKSAELHVGHCLKDIVSSLE